MTLPTPQSLLPASPYDVLKISTEELLAAIKQKVATAKQSGEWQRPYQDAATSLEEMTLEDIFYWAYKSANPIIKGEPGVEQSLAKSPFTNKLPAGFHKQSSLTIGAVGDLLQAEGLEHSRDIIFESIADVLFDQDISYANFESPVTKQPLVKEIIGDEGAPIECCNEDQFETLAAHKNQYFTVLNTANNHMLDMGLEGIDTTLRKFKENGITAVGTNSSAIEAGKGICISYNNIKVGFASATFGLNDHQLPPDEAYRINTAKLLSKFCETDLDLMKRQILDCKDQGSDFIIASLHWGYEFEMFPRLRQIEAAHELAEFGADAIICHHPHVIQPVEYYQTVKDPNRIAPIAYSLGSVTWGYTAPHIALSLLQNLTLAKGTLDGRPATYVEAATTTPIFRSVVERNGKAETRIEKLAEHLRDQNSPHTSSYLNEMKQYADLVLGDWQQLSQANKTNTLTGDKNKPPFNRSL